MEQPTREQLIDEAQQRLRALLHAEHYEVGSRPDVDLSSAQSAQADYALWTLNQKQGTYTELIVEARSTVSPRDVDQILGGMPHLVRAVGRNPPVVIVAPWISKRTQELLRSKGFNYLDLTGNVFIRIPHPAIYLWLQGADRSPYPEVRGTTRIQGGRANALVRILADVQPPYSHMELVNATKLSPGYVSQLLDALDDLALIRRTRRGRTVHVTDVDWQGVLQLRTQSYGLLKSNEVGAFVSPGGPDNMIRQLTEDAGAFGPAVVTGSYAAAAVAPVAAPSQLALYVEDPARVRIAAGLLPTRRGADVLLLRAADPSQVERPRDVDGVNHVGLSQLAMDCLTGNGRLPEEGEAILDWMQRHESVWRISSLAALNG
jgi:hypothetical protein